ncbi:hypothetical protein CRE_19024 [Caenorhabditis remanei]|uniref:Serpentine Receptor, class H n=1 Tax=Caenorhabditis remanei TaxID=31234 RepID=E3LL60_CAERE|nr:hypothetical protein CRE_19024 [Caenorhabditis remanei]
MYLDTPEFLSLSLHAITIFATPLHILGIYCILCQTPKSMSSGKWVIFNFHSLLVYDFGLLPLYILESPIYVLAIDFRWVVIPVNILIVIYIIEWYPLFSLLSRSMKRSMKMTMHSKSTLKMQKKFLKAIYAQAVVFLKILQIPVFYFSFSIFGDVYIQAANNLSFVFLALHGIACTVGMLLFHKPYREYCYNLFRISRNRKVSKALIISIVPSNAMGHSRRISTF